MKNVWKIMSFTTNDGSKFLNARNLKESIKNCILETTKRNMIETISKIYKTAYVNFPSNMITL